MTNTRNEQEGQSTVDPFLIDVKELTQTGKKLGEGSYGTVTEGEWRGNMVAIKTIVHNHIYEDLKNCQDENAILKLVSHPKIVAFSGYSIEGPKYYFVTELMSKGSLRNMLDKGEVTDINLGYKFMQDFMSAVVYLLSINILHCDLKADNILVNHQLIAKLCDFGFAKKNDGQPHSPCSPLWAAPEVLQKSLRSEKSEAYSCAFVFYEIVSSNIPFQGYPDLDSEEKLCTFLLAGRRPSIPMSCPLKVASLITWGFKTNPDERPSLTEMKTEIDQLLLKKH